MRKFLEFLKHLMSKNESIPTVEDMSFISSEIKDSEETIIHGKGKWWVKIILQKDESKKKGEGRITTNLPNQLNEEDIVWLLKKYL